MTIQKNQYRLDVRIEKLAPMKIDVIDTVTVGLDPRSDLVLSGPKIKNHHMAFHKKGENLALHYLGNTNQTFLNSLPLEADKVYLLGPGDTIQLSGVEIIIRHEVVHIEERPKIHAVVFDSADDLKPESIKEGILFKDKLPFVQAPVIERLHKEIKHEIKQEMNLEKGKFISLWINKFYALLADFFFTYLILVTLLPLVFAESYALKILNFLSAFVYPSGNHAFFKFFIAWYFFSFAQTMVLGTTLGQFLTGLRNKNESTYGKLILFRLKTFVFSLFLLPAQNTVSEKLFFKAMRKVGMALILVAILFAPLFLPPPYNQFIEVSQEGVSLKRELKTKTISSASKDLMMNLHTELSTRYMLLPIIYKDSGVRSFQLIDLKTDEKIIIFESERILYNDIDRLLEYGNPLYSVLHSTALKDLPLKNRKQLLKNALTISPYNLQDTSPKFGPFFGAAVLLKEKILKDTSQNNTVVNFYAPETPLFHVSSSQQDYFYLLSPVGLSRFVVDSTKRGPLVLVLEEEIFKKLLHDPEIGVEINNQRVEILEAQDAFLHGDEHTLLTYYVGVANSLANQKIVHDEVDLTNKAKLAVISNIEFVQKFIKNKNVYKSFDDIKYQLTPMENPGVLR